MRITKLNDLTDGNKVIQGRWHLNNRHEIQYRERGKAKRAAFKAAVIDVKPASLVIQSTVNQENGKTVSRVQQLTGRWQMDPKNRLTFLVTRREGRTDTLTFTKRWKVDKNHEIEYRYRDNHRLVFKGYWDILEKNRLTYWLSRDSDSYFRFRGTFQTRSILAKKGEIRYQAALTVEKRPRSRPIILSGRWRYSRRYGLNFEIEYRDGRRHAIRFGGEYNFTPDRRLEVKLTTPAGRPLGLELVLTQDFLKGQGRVFARLARNARESALEAGLKLKW